MKAHLLGSSHALEMAGWLTMLAVALVGVDVPADANINSWAEHDGKFYAFAGSSLEFDLSLNRACGTPDCRVLGLPPGATVGNDPNLKLYWDIPADRRGLYSASHQFCELLSEGGGSCAVWGPVLVTPFFVVPYLEIPAIEITQSIQNLHNQMPLVPHKETYVRVYVQMAHSGESYLFESAAAELHAYDDETDQELPGSPVQPINLRGYVYPVTIDVTDPDADSKRKRWGSTLNFQLDRSWLWGSVRLEVTDPDGQPLFDCDPLLNPGGPESTCAALALFHPELELHPSGVPATWPELKFVGMQWRDSQNRMHDPMPGGSVEVPTEFAERLVSMTPIDGVTWDAFKLFWSLEDVPHRIATYPTRAEVEVFYAEQLLKLLRIGFADYRANDEGTIPFYHGLLSGPVGPYRASDGKVRRINGMSSIPGLAAISRADRPKTFVHEFMHLLGLQHAVSSDTTPSGRPKGPCGEVAAIGTPEFGRIYEIDGKDRATIGKMIGGQDWRDFVFGLDTVLSEEGEPLVLAPDESFAITSYCEDKKKRWTSDLTYADLVENIWDGAGFLDDHEGVLLGGFVGRIRVLGRILLSEPSAVLAPLFETSTYIDPPSLPAGPYSVQLLDGSGGVLQEIAFEPLRLELDVEVEEGGTVEPSQVALFWVTADADPAIAQVVVRQGSTILATQQTSASPPTVQVLSPNGGELLSGSEAVVSWAGADLDGDPLTYMLEYSADDGAHWAPLAVELTQTEYTVETHLLTATLQGRMRVTASDGMHSASDDSDAVFSVPNHPPRVIVTSPEPGDDTLFIGGQSISFRASAIDREDGPIPDADIEWWSNVDGLLGYGRSLSVAASSLSEGTHVIFAAASDWDWEVGIATTGLRVLHTAPAALTDLAVRLDGPAELVPTHQPLTIVMTLDNRGPDAASGVASVTTIPAFVDVDAVTSSTGSCVTTTGQVACTIGMLTADDSATITIDAHVTEVGDFPIAATVSGGEVDPGLGDNADTLLVPEPSLRPLFLGGLAVLVGLGRRRATGKRRCTPATPPVSSRPPEPPGRQPRSAAARTASRRPPTASGSPFR